MLFDVSHGDPRDDLFGELLDEEALDDKDTQEKFGPYLGYVIDYVKACCPGHQTHVVPAAMLDLPQVVSPDNGSYLLADPRAHR